MPVPTFIVDFDSTFIRVEALELLGEISLAGRPDREAALAQVRALTAAAMNGEVGFGESLARRLEMLRPRREHIADLVVRLEREVSASILRNRGFFQRNRDRIYLVTGGFDAYVAPVAEDFGLAASHLLANRLTWGRDGVATGVDAANPLARDGGKSDAVRELGLAGEVVVVGDGWTDFEIRQAGAADRFHAFTENVARPAVLAVADRVSASWEEVLRHEGLSPD
jgi:D-3-phosphoglycerate dehydrogenase